MEPTGGERGNWCLTKSEKWAGARSYRALLTRARSLDLSQIGRGNQRSWYWISFLKVNNYVTGKAYETVTFRHWIKSRARFGVLRENVKWVSRSPWLSVWWTLWDTVEGIRARTEHRTGIDLCGQRPEFAWAAGTLSGRVPERKELCQGGIPGMCTAALWSLSSNAKTYTKRGRLYMLWVQLLATCALKRDFKG